MRPIHIKAMLPLALETVFIPDAFEIEALQVRATEDVIMRKLYTRQQHYSRTAPTLFNWFGSIIRPEPIDGA